MKITIDITPLPTKDRIFIGEPLGSGHARSDPVIVRAAGAGVVFLIGSEKEGTLRAYSLKLADVLEQITVNEAGPTNTLE